MTGWWQYWATKHAAYVQLINSVNHVAIMWSCFRQNPVTAAWSIKQLEPFDLPVLASVCYHTVNLLYHSSSFCPAEPRGLISEESGLDVTLFSSPGTRDAPCMSGCLSTPRTKSGYLLLYVHSNQTASLPFLFPLKLLKYRSHLTELILIVPVQLHLGPAEVEKKNASNYESLSAFLWCRNNTQNSHWVHVAQPSSIYFLEVIPSHEGGWGWRWGGG